MAQENTGTAEIFENEIDQTYLRDFSKALYSDYKKCSTDKFGETR